MTKEEIIRHEFSDKLDEYIDDTGEYFITQAERCMDQYAKQQAIAFGEWLREGEYQPRDKSDVGTWVQLGSKVGWLQGGMSIIHTTAQLYTKFLTLTPPPTTLS